MSNIVEIINGSNQVIKDNIKVLAKDYKEKTGRVVCTSCPSDIQYMISSLKHLYKMVNYQFKRERAQYKIAKGDKFTISNDTLTDELAEKFLNENPERIALFSKFPKDWKKKVKVVKVDDSGDDEAIKAAEAEAKKSAELEADKAIEEALAAAREAAEGDSDDDCDECPEDEPCEECKEKKRKELSKMKLSELREAYPEIKATSIADFVDKVVN